MKKTLMVNLIGQPGAGKSTMAADIFARLKWDKIDCELITEFAKELIWEERQETFKNEVYLFAKQFHRLFRVNGKVDVIVTDRPIILSMYYNQKYGSGQFDALDDLVLEQHHKFFNLNILLNRTKEYNPNGRNQTEEESDEIGLEIKAMLDRYNIPYIEIDGNESNVGVIVDAIKMIMSGGLAIYGR